MKEKLKKVLAEYLELKDDIRKELNNFYLYETEYDYLTGKAEGLEEMAEKIMECADLEIVNGKVIEKKGSK